MSVLDSMKNYFEENTREQIEKDWKESEKFDKVGPTCDEFLSYHSNIINKEIIKQKISIETSDIIIPVLKHSGYNNSYSDCFSNYDLVC